MRLPKSIIKKYGITKKAWAVFKGKKTTTRRVNKVAKRRRTRTRTRSFFKRRSSRSKGLNLGTIILGGAIYGAGRQYLSKAISPLTSKIPMGNVADNIGLGVVSYFAATKGKGIIKDIGKAGLTIEAAMGGQDLMAGRINGNNGLSW